MERTRAQLEWRVFNSLPWHYFFFSFFFCAVLLDNNDFQPKCDCQTDCAALNPQSCSRTRVSLVARNTEAEEIAGSCVWSPGTSTQLCSGQNIKKLRKKKNNLSAGQPARLP